jgi:predicted AlkP superfamily pyrophosphatase or phosphodiesterase
MRRPVNVNRGTTCLAFCLVAVLGCKRPPEARPSAPVTADGPRLIVLVAVDQLPYEYIPRFDTLFTGGLRRLLDQGVLFENARFGHGVTVTAPGHATLATGLHPSSSGIVDNYWFDRKTKKMTYSFEDPQHERSPVNMKGTTLPDWIKGGPDPGARVYAVSGKDRAGIAMAGHEPDGVYWYDDKNGGFETSTYYVAELPDWVEAWNDQRRTDEFFAKAYDPLAPVIESAQALGIQELDEGLFTRRYPFVFGGPAIGPDLGFYEEVGNSPLLDELVLSFARTIVERHELGRRDHLDYLAIGLSSLDLSGHRYGPQSPQVADTLLRVDRQLGAFLDFLDRQIGKDRYVVALSSDHGVAPIPEQRIAQGLPARRPGAVDALCFQQAGERVQAQFNLERWVLEGFYLDRDAIKKAGADPSEVEAAIARELETCDIVERAWTSAELQSAAANDEDAFRTLYRHSFDPERSGDLLIQLVEYAIPAGLVATHGSPYDYDRHVPVFVMAPGLGKARIADEVAIVDLAPTLAGLLGVPAPKVDGRDLTDLMLTQITESRRLPAFAATSAGNASTGGAESHP